MKNYLYLSLVLLLTFFTQQSLSQIKVIYRSPGRNELNSSVTIIPVLKFSNDVLGGTQGDMHVFSAQRGGRINGVYGSFANVLEFFPASNFRPGETISVTVPATITGTTGKEVYQFTTATGGTGGGNFMPGSTVSTGLGPSVATGGDIDGDGDIDLIVGNYSGGTISVRLNNGAGVFSGTQELALGGSLAMVVLADIDADGDLDLLVSGVANPGKVYIRLNNGAGNFSTGFDLVTGNSPYNIVVGDVDADGDLDLLVSNYGGSTVEVYLNNGAGGFSLNQSINAPSAYSIVLADLDNDGDLDFLVTLYGTSKVEACLNNGNGTFSEAAIVTAGHSPVNITVGDIDSDGDQDFLTANLGSNTVSVRLNNGDGTFSGTTDLSVPGTPYGVGLGDLNADGNLDFVVSCHDTNSIQTWLNSSTGTFTKYLNNTAVGAGPYSIFLADVDSDNDLDLITPNQNGSNVTVLLNGPPAVTNVSADIANGIYKAGDVIPISATFSAAVMITGTPQLKLETGTVDRVVDYTSGSGTSKIVFNYTVQEGDITADLDCFNSGALALNDGSIKYANGTPAVLSLPVPGTIGSLGANRNIVIDGLAPTLTSVTISSGNENASQAKIDDKVTLIFTASESITVPAVTVAGHGIIPVNTNGNIWKAIYKMVGTDSEGLISFSIAFKDAAGNMGTTVTATTDNTKVNFDSTIPAKPVVNLPANGETVLTATPVIGGIAEAETEVSLNIDGNLFSGILVNRSGNWTYVPASLSNGSHTVKALTKDAAGNNSDYGNVNNFTVNNSPTIYATSIANLKSTYGTVSNATSFTVSGTNLVTGIVASLPDDFEISDDNIIFGAKVAIAVTSTPSKILYIRLRKTAIAGNHSGNVVLTSDGANNLNVSIPVSLVSPASLTVTAVGKNKTYDGTANATVAIVDNRVNGDLFSINYTAIFANKHVGMAKSISINSISISGGASANYTLNVTTASASANIIARAINVTAQTDAKTYDGSALSAVMPIVGILQPGDAVIEAPRQIFDNKNIGNNKTLAPSGLLINDGNNGANYNINYVSNTTGSIGTRPIEIAATAQTKTYGAKLTAGASTNYFSITGTLAFGEFVTNVILSVDAAGLSATTAAGASYLITPSDAKGTGGFLTSNYNITYTPYKGNVTRKVLTITADHKERFAGAANPILTASYSGFVNNESNTILTTQPKLSTTATLVSLPADYDINISGATASNYAITHVKGFLTVKASLPTSITLTGLTLYENRPAGTAVGTLNTTSGDPGATFTYTLVRGEGDTDNALFTTSGPALITAASLNYENKTSYSIRVKSTNQYSLGLEKVFTIALSDVNEIPEMDAIANRTICFTANQQSVNLTGVSAGPESAQTTTLSISSTNAALFSNLTVIKNGATSGIINYTPAAGANGFAVVTVTVKDNGGTANGGVDTYTRTFNININALPVIAINSDKGLVVSKGETLLLTATGGVGYSWSNANGILSGQNTGTLAIRPSATTTYTVTVTNASNCSEVKDITIVINDNYAKIKATNILTPNGDGVNDVWVVDNIDLYPNNEVKIFDRGGRILYTKRAYNNSWTAIVNGKVLDDGTYYYIIDFGDGRLKVKGYITVITENQ